ncbi:MAG: hypothetical protein LKF15_01380 [Lachnospiraceae bacterium]|jgi:hypothetical protein|nr:hypothetical protein [Lachnospiraceae bacterium]MCH4027614.1 hypothetical protein [Lachnospiraceae bacterium]MCH4065454.1 hypothetical protein [Lachnospiraceae bacterium]MCH4111494.1 hypothetical protein [Lachnospiraceae bacterium]
MPETKNLQEIYAGYKQDFEELEKARKEYEETMFRTKKHGKQNKYYVELTEVTKNHITESYNDLIDKCQSAINEALNNLGPSSDASLIQKLVDLENVILEVKNGGFVKPSPFSEILAKMRENAGQKNANGLRKKGNTTDESNNPYGPKSLEADEKYRVAMMNNSKGTLLLMSGALRAMNRSFKSIGVRAYFGLSETTDSIYRAWKTKNLESEIQYNRDLNDIAMSINKDRVAELVQNERSEKKLFHNSAAHAVNYLHSFTKTVTQELAASNQRLTNMFLTEIESMTQTIDRSEQMLRKSKTKGFDESIIEMETNRVLSKAESVIEKIPNDTIFRTGVKGLSIVKEDGKMIYMRRSQPISREEFVSNLYGGARTMSSNFKKYAEKELNENSIERIELRPRNDGEEH